MKLDELRTRANRASAADQKRGIHAYHVRELRAIRALKDPNMSVSVSVAVPEACTSPASGGTKNRTVEIELHREQTLINLGALERYLMDRIAGCEAEMERLGVEFEPADV